MNPSSNSQTTTKSEKSTKTADGIDLSIFKTESTHCNNTREINGIIKSCGYLQRLAMGLKYYHLLFMNDEQLNKSKVSKEIFNQFSVETYGQILNDWNHFILKHGSNDELIQIANELQNIYGLHQCDVTKCGKLRRHYRDRQETEKKEKTEDGDEAFFAFYIDCYDRLHHHIFHLFSMGLRLKETDEKEGKLSDDIDDDIFKWNDKGFELKRDLIHKIKKQNIFHDLQRYNEGNNKFNIKVDSDNIDNKQIETADGTTTTFLDEVYLFIQQYETTGNMIESKIRKGRYARLKGLIRCSKFNGKQVQIIEFSEKRNRWKVTLLDENQKEVQLAVKQENMEHIFEEIAALKQYMIENHYDSDAVKNDLEDFIENEETSNLYKNINNPLYIRLITKYIKNLQLSAQSFSTGFVFFYEEPNTWRERKNWNKKEIGDWLHGYSRCQLFVKPRFDSLKTEILESTFLSLKQWQENIVLKGMEYHKTDKTKKMHLDLMEIYCFCLYCDWTDLCASFSNTFRKKHEFEPIESLIKRHSNFYHFSKGIITAVDVFGIDGNLIYDDDEVNVIDGERGPFYCGLSLILNIPSFAIYLKGPCSTSKNIEIALNFAKRDGLIIQLQNDYGAAQEQTFFDCSWISNYSEENERLFIAGNKRLRIQSVIIIESAQNFEEFMHAVYIFDAMISGVNKDWTSDEMLGISSSDVLIIDQLCSLNSMYNLEMDSYTKNSFQLFCNNKTKIEMNIHFLATKFKAINHLFMHHVGVTKKRFGKKIKSRSKHIDLLNVLNPSIFCMFPNLNQVVINTRYTKAVAPCQYTYSFDLLSFLSSIQLSKASITYVIRSERFVYPFKIKSWCGNILSVSIKEQYAMKKWKIKYEKQNDSDCLIISKFV